MATPFTAPLSELTVLGSVLKHGRELLFDVESLAEAADFQDEDNQVVYESIREYFADEGSPDRVSYAGLLAAARKVGCDAHLQQPAVRELLRTLKHHAVEPAQARAEAGRLLKLRIARGLHDAAQEAASQLRAVTGDEMLDAIVTLAENPILDFSARLNSDAGGTHQVAQGASEWFEDVVANPRENIGIPSPFPKYNVQIGGGFRRKSISIIAARPKSGKTVCVDNIAMHIAGTLGIPVFNLDTEMTAEEHWARILAFLTGIEITRIESGRVDAGEADRVRDAIKYLADIPYYYRSVIDETFEEQVAAMRRWAVKTVGVDKKGVRGDCLVIYDYLQLTDPGEFKGNNFKEYQLLGFQMVGLSRMMKRYDLPILSMLQLNRDGIDKDTTAAAAGSDRIIWKTANFSTLKRKTPEEIDEDGAEHGNTKLRCLIARHGPGADDGDYIHLKFDRATARLTEGLTRFELNRLGGRKTSAQRTFEVEDEPQDIQLDTGT